MSQVEVKFTPMPDPAFVRDQNLANLLRTIRSNIHSAFGLYGGNGFQPRILEEKTTGSASGQSGSASEVAGGAARMLSCTFDVSTGVGGVGTHYLNLVLPAGAVLIRAFCVVQEEFTGAGGAELGIRAGDGADEFTVFANSPLASAWDEGYHDSVSIGQSAGESARAFKAIVSGGDMSKGRMIFFAEYVGCE